MGLESFMQRATQISQRIILSHCQVLPAACPPVPEPMPVNTSCLTLMERSRCLEVGLCFRGSLHQGQSRPTPMPSGEYPSIRPWYFHSVPTALTTSHLRLFCFSVCPFWLWLLWKCNLLSRRNMPRRHQTRELQVETIQTQPLRCGWVKYRAYLMTLKVGCLYKETITFLELEGSTVDIILGSLLNLYSPEVRWDPCEITRWSESCHQNWFSAFPRLPSNPVKIPVCSTLVESPKPLDSPTILPKGRVYPLSIPESKAIADYI